MSHTEIGSGQGAVARNRGQEHSAGPTVFVIRCLDSVKSLGANTHHLLPLHPWSLVLGRGGQVCVVSRVFFFFAATPSKTKLVFRLQFSVDTDGWQNALMTSN